MKEFKAFEMWIMFGLGTILGCMIATTVMHSIWKASVIEHNAAHYEIDRQTGESTFVWGE